MISLESNYLITPYHTFGLKVRADYFVNVTEEAEINDILTLPYRPRMILGGGSNILFSKNYQGIIIRNVITGIEILEQRDNQVLVEVGGGVIWHDLVLWALSNDFGGLENLSLIPGTVGAAPIQNIGAYGVEFDSVFHRLKAVDLNTGNSHVFNKEDCGFGYRNSIFKEALKDKYLITRVQIKLSTDRHNLCLDYGDIKKTLSGRAIEQPTIRDVSDAVIRIRTSKLPDPQVIGNAGSFFKNPLLSPANYEALLSTYPDMPCYPTKLGKVKIPAAWLIERAGWKGFRKGDAGVYEKHALVLVNHGNATGEEMHQLAEGIKASILEIFNISLESEVNWV
jgi:UDP-N-acetylmuramate dehydrogenase